MKKNNPAALKFIGLVFAGIGLLFASVGGFLYSQELDFISKAERAPGKVTAMLGGKGRKPVVTFMAAAGDDTEAREFQITGSVSSSPPAYTVGEQVTVLYPPGHPEDGHIEGFLEQYFLCALFGGLGVIFFLVGSGLYLGSLKAAARQEPQVFGET